MSKQPPVEAPASEEPILEQSAQQPDYEALYKRQLADQENARKRHEQERLSFSKFALEGVVEDLLPVVDNFDRALSHVPAEQAENAWITGILYIQKQLADVLERHGATEIPTKEGDRFDHNLHEAIGTEQRDGVEEDHIIAIKTKGYRLHDRVLRPTQVIVSSK